MVYTQASRMTLALGRAAGPWERLADRKNCEACGREKGDQSKKGIPRTVTVGENEAIFATSSGMACVTANNKLFLVWTLKRNSAAEMDSPWSTKSWNFTNNKSLAAICWQGLLAYSVRGEETQTELSASHTVPHLFKLSESTTAEKL